MAIALAGAGHRLVDVAGCWDGATDRLAATWVQDGVQSSGTWALPIEAYQRVFEQKTRRGSRPDRLSFYPTPTGVHVCVLWVRQGAPWEAHHGMDAAAYQATFTRLAGAGFRLLDVCGYEEHGQERYAAVWEQQPGAAPWAGRHGIRAEDFQSQFDALGREGLVPERLNGYTLGGQVFYAGVWSQPTAPAVSVRHGVGAADYQRVFDDHAYQGYRPASVRPTATPWGVEYAAIFHHDDIGWEALRDVDALVESFRYGYDVPGLSLAVSQHGRLVYARALGQADPAAGTPLSVRHRMRVASVSKPVTAAAILLLVQRGQLALTDQVLGAGGLLGTTYGTAPYDADETAITVDHLLTHTAGFRRPPDPMFEQPSLDHAALLGWVIDNTVPASTPGTVYDYSNVGYCLLGRVVEQVTGQAYDDFVRRSVLTPAGATSMQLAGDTAADRAPDEVAYVGQGGEDPYGMRVRRMDAHGGWIATPIDLLRFLRAVDGREGGLDLLDATHATLMSTPPAGVVDMAGNPTSYARGCAVATDYWDHNGALPGTMAVIRRLPDGVGHAAAMNTRKGGAGEGPMLTAVQGLLDEVTTRLGPLPSYDLF